MLTNAATNDRFGKVARGGFVKRNNQDLWIGVSRDLLITS